MPRLPYLSRIELQLERVVHALNNGVSHDHDLANKVMLSEQGQLPQFIEYVRRNGYPSAYLGKNSVIRKAPWGAYVPSKEMFLVPERVLRGTVYYSDENITYVGPNPRLKKKGKSSKKEIFLIYVESSGKNANRKKKGRLDGFVEIAFP